VDDKKRPGIQTLFQFWLAFKPMGSKKTLNNGLAVATAFGNFTTHTGPPVQGGLRLDRCGWGKVAG